MIQPPHLAEVLVAVAVILLTVALVATHARRLIWRLPLRLGVLIVCALLVQCAADLTLRQQSATLDQIIEAGHASDTSHLVLDAGTVRDAHGQVLRPSLPIRFASLELPIHVHAGSYAPLGTSRLATAAKSGCSADASARCTYDAASGQLTVTYH